MALRKLVWSEKSDKIETFNTMCKDIESLNLTNFFTGNNSPHANASTQFACYVYSTCGVFTADEQEQTKYTPSSFEAGNTFAELVEGARFSDEMIVVTDSQLKKSKK